MAISLIFLQTLVGYDNRNISSVLELQREKNGKGGFQQIFSNIVSKVDPKSNQEN